MEHVHILGNIGSGKTELAKVLATSLPSFQVILEPDVGENPYLKDFLASPREYAFHNQLYFLTIALEAYKISASYNNLVQDYSILGCPLFAEALMRHGWLNSRDYALYERLCVSIIDSIPKPALYIVTQAKIATLMSRIKERGRSSEVTTKPEYLETLQNLHESKLMRYWIPKYYAPVLCIDTDIYDLKSQNGSSSVVTAVKSTLTSL